MQDLMKKLREAAAYIRKQIGDMDIDAGLVLGSGLGDMAGEIKNPVFVNYKDIPHFPVSTVPGHAGRLVIGSLEGKNVLCMQGRFHFYEGWSMDQVVFPVQVMKVLGVKNLILTNAAGCINKDWRPGDLMIITDHLKLTTSENPMRGHNEEELGLRFFDMSRAYDPDLIIIAKGVAKEQGIDIRQGVYMFFAGPSFETPAEIRAARLLGADACGMSTVPEVIAAAHCGLKTLGISCMTNMAAGILDQPLGHDEVLETGLKVKKSFAALIKGILEKI
ncbi:MAG: purine-nucleoside phosphorylase [Sphaerochaetaceae bacterium]|nr:purine-nucleoside phosphorylase [Sphaerochaetaceae bacterium]